MATAKQATKVGIFLVAGGLVSAAVLLAITGVTPRDSKQYLIRFQEDVAGLTNGSKVLFRGVECGRVMSMIVDERGDVIVDIEIKSESVPPLREGVQAQLAPVGISGLVRIILAYEPGVEPGEVLAQGAYIPVRPSFLAALMSDLPHIISQVDDTMGYIAELLSQLRPEDVRELAHNTRDLVATITASATDVIGSATTALDEYRLLASEMRVYATGTLMEFETLARNLDSQVARLGPKLDKAIPEVTGNLNQAVIALDETLAVARDAMSSVTQAIEAIDLADLGPSVHLLIDDATTTLRGVDRMTDALADQSDKVGHEMMTVLADLRTTLVAVERLVSYLERDPASPIFGRSTRDRMEDERR